MGDESSVGNKENRVTRRQFLEMAANAVGAALVASACGRIPGSSAPVKDTPPTPKAISKTVPPTRSEGISQNSITTKEGDTIWLDNEGIPVQGKTTNGEEFSFNTDVVKGVRETALSTKEPEIVQLISVPSSGPPFLKESQPPKSLEKHQPVKDKPSDVVPFDELQEKYGVKIIQGTGTILYVRRNAFEPDGVFDFLKRKNRELIIAIMPGPFVMRRYCLDSKYDSVRNYLPRDLVLVSHPELGGYTEIAEDYSDELAANMLKLEIENTEKHLADEKQKSSSVRDDERLLRLKFELTCLKTYVTPDDLALFFSKDVKDRKLAAGMHTRFQNTDIIFVAVGTKPRKDVLMTYFDAIGKGHVERIPQLYNYPTREIGLMPWESFPDPTDIEAVPFLGPGGRFALFSTPPLNLLHEIGHAELGQAEDWADTDMIWILERAFKTNKYPFVWELPKDQGGGYIISQQIIPGLKASVA